MTDKYRVCATASQSTCSGISADCPSCGITACEAHHLALHSPDCYYLKKILDNEHCLTIVVGKTCLQRRENAYLTCVNCLRKFRHMMDVILKWI